MQFNSDNSNPNDSESSSNSDIIDLTSNKAVPVSEMYNDDIDYMDSYLKSLPDYNELNKKITNEQQRCEDIYDRLQSINSSLKLKLLPKSNSYHSICTASTQPYRNANNVHAMQSISARNDNSDTAKNKIHRSSSSSIVNQKLINNPDTVGLYPIKPPHLSATDNKQSELQAKQQLPLRTTTAATAPISTTTTTTTPAATTNKPVATTTTVNDIF